MNVLIITIDTLRLEISAGSVKSALDKLRKIDVIEKVDKRYKIIDPFFARWLKNL